jgi:hypothetical protein
MNAYNRHLTRFLIDSFCYFRLPVQSAHAEGMPICGDTAADRAESAQQWIERHLQREDIPGFINVFNFTRSAKT